MNDAKKFVAQWSGRGYEQAQRYGNGLPYSMRSRWIVVCNFAEFLIYDMETLDEPTRILLTELPEKFHAFVMITHGL